MPELPDVQVLSERLNELAAGSKIIRLSFLKDKRVSPNAPEITTAFEDKFVQSFGRFGKQLILTSSSNDNLLVHLMLKGRVSRKKPASEKSVSAELELDIGALYFYDPMSWISFEMSSDLSALNLDAAPDALDEHRNTRTYFQDTVRKNPERRIKSVLIDQKFILGIGNAYADEILHAAKLHPASVCNKIPMDKLDFLYNRIRSVLLDGIEQLRKTENLEDVIDQRNFFKVHVPKRTHTDDGQIIVVEDVDGKKTYYSSKQVLYI